MVCNGLPLSRTLPSSYMAASVSVLMSGLVSGSEASAASAASFSTRMAAVLARRVFSSRWTSRTRSKMTL